MKVTKLAGFVLSICFLAPVWAFAQSDSPDVGLVSKITGEVVGSGEKPTPVQSFMKVRPGDRFAVPEGGSLQILYFDGGRQETWKGPVTLVAEEKGSRADVPPQASPADVKYLPAKATKRMAVASLPPPGSSLQFSGAIQTMAPRKTSEASAASRQGTPGQAKQADPRELKAAKSLYNDMRKAAPADDLTPEVYYLGVLADHRQYKEMERLVASMLKVRPSDPTLLDWKVWIDRQSALKAHGFPAPGRKK